MNRNKRLINSRIKRIAYNTYIKIKFENKGKILFFYFARIWIWLYKTRSIQLTQPSPLIYCRQSLRGQLARHHFLISFLNCSRLAISLKCSFLDLNAQGNRYHDTECIFTRLKNTLTGISTVGFQLYYLDHNIT